MFNQSSRVLNPLIKRTKLRESRANRGVCARCDLKIETRNRIEDSFAGGHFFTFLEAGVGPGRQVGQRQAGASLITTRRARHAGAIK